VNLYYTGLTDTAQVTDVDGALQTLSLARDYSVPIHVSIPSGGFGWYVIE
jgi:hypothetical protein